MVHKKSEYRLNYKWNPANIYQQTWETGFNYRVQRRLHDYSHLPLPWETHSCKCDDDEGEKLEAHLPVPKTRLKHNVLTEQWERKKRSETPAIAAPEPAYKFDNVANDTRNRDDWYREWEEKEHQKTPSPIPSARSHSADRIRHIAREKLESPKYEGNQEPEDFIDHGYDSRPQSPNLLTRGTQTLPALSKRLPQAQARELQVTEPSPKVTCMPKFLPYGWNSKRDVSDKKTFNVFAPTRHLSQFYPSAIRAWKKREDDITKSVEHERRSPQAQVARSVDNVIMYPSSVWMTEYQKQYSARKPHVRPATAPPANLRQLGGLYHKCCV